MRVLVTGAGGFVGSHLCARLARSGWDVHAVVRHNSAGPLHDVAHVHRIADVAQVAERADLLSTADAVVHLAARVHVMHDTAADAPAEYRRVNTTATATLARLAARHGVRCFVLLSTVKVNGERTASKPFSETDPPNPGDPYSISKLEAEQRLAEAASGTNMSAICLRAPLIYGPGVKGNFLRLMGLVRRRVPLPLADAHNARSLLYVENLASAIEELLKGPPAGAATFLVSDDHDLSTPELIRGIAKAMGVEPRLWRCPLPVLVGLARIAGREEEIRRMVESLTLDCSRLKQALQWTPPFTVDHGMGVTARWFLDRYSQRARQ